MFCLRLLFLRTCCFLSKPHDFCYPRVSSSYFISSRTKTWYFNFSKFFVKRSLNLRYVSISLGSPVDLRKLMYKSHFIFLYNRTLSSISVRKCYKLQMYNITEKHKYGKHVMHTLPIDTNLHSVKMSNHQYTQTYTRSKCYITDTHEPSLSQNVTLPIHANPHSVKTSYYRYTRTQTR